MKYCVVILLVLSHSLLIAQDADPSEVMQDHIDQPEEEEVIWQEALSDYYRTPLDLNKATREDLQQIIFLSPAQIESLLEHRSRYGQLLDVIELQVVAGFDLPTVYKLLPLVTVSTAKDPTTVLKEYFRPGKNYFLLRFDRVLEQKRGYKHYSGPAYAGSADRFICRFRSSVPGQYSYGFLLEKDAGEAFLWNKELKTYGFDYYSFHIAVFDRGRVKGLIVGDYNLQFGQGLVLGSSFAFGKGPFVVQAGRKVQRGVIPYSSLNEAGFFRGAASTVRLGKLVDLTGFFSYRKNDASYVNDTAGSFRSFSGSGLHRTYSEMLRKKVVGETVVGMNLNVFNRSRKFSAGLTTASTYLEYRIEPNTEPHRKFNFSGDQNHIAGLNWSWYGTGINFFGEGAVSSSGGKGCLTGLLKSLSREADFLLLLRHYEKDFHSFYGNAFSENSSPANETGIYTGLSLRPHRKVVVNAYFDYFHFPWLRYQVDAPGSGHEYLLRFTYTFSKKTIFYLQYREELKQKNLSGNETHTDLPVDFRKSYLILNLKDGNDHLTWQSRMVFSALNGQYSGLTLLGDISLKHRYFTISGRYAVFDAPVYETRHYVHEQDLMYTFSIPAYYGQGIRSYLVFRAKLARQADISLKISRTRWFDRETNGSANEQIDAPHKTEFRMQVVSRF